MRKFVLEHSPCVGNSRINFELVLNSCPRISLEIAIISSRFCYKRISSTFMGMHGIKIAFTGFTNKNFNEDASLIVSPFGFFRIVFSASASRRGSILERLVHIESKYSAVDRCELDVKAGSGNQRVQAAIRREIGLTKIRLISKIRLK